MKKFIETLPFFQAQAKRALLELVLVQATILLVWPFINHAGLLHLFKNDAAIFFLFYNLSSILWCGLRWRLRPSSRSRWHQLLIEIEVAGVVLLEFFVSFSICLFLLESISFYSFFKPFTTVLLESARIYVMVPGCGLLFFSFRLFIYIWRFWDQLRRTHLRWALTHAHLMVVVIGAGIISFLLICIAMLANSNNQSTTFFPLVILPVMIILTCIVLAFVLPPSALFSYLFARRTTRRIEKLAAATSALRGGNYGVRVAIEGEDEIARLQADFNIMAAHLERTLYELQAERDNVATLLTARRELIANVSHELRTPVATVRSYLESTLTGWDEQPPETLHQDLHVMEQQTIRLQSLINDLFTLSRAEVKRLELRCVPSNVELLVFRVTETTAPMAWRSSRVEVITDIASIQPAFPLALIDESRLEQVLQNLLHNGIRHTPPGGIIVVSADADDQAVILQIKDTGEGIPATEIERIWERFYRTEHARKQYGNGTGLGLAIVKELTEAMEGTVSVMSTPGQGTCFTIRVPRVPAAQPFLTIPSYSIKTMPLT